MARKASQHGLHAFGIASNTVNGLDVSPPNAIEIVAQGASGIGHGQVADAWPTAPNDLFDQIVHCQARI